MSRFGLKRLKKSLQSPKKLHKNKSINKRVLLGSLYYGPGVGVGVGVEVGVGVGVGVGDDGARLLRKFKMLSMKAIT